MRWLVMPLFAGAALSVPATVMAAETITYSYDELGRLTGAATAGGPNAGTTVATTYDPAGNRCTYILDDGVGTDPPSPAGCTSGGGGNQPPVAENDSGSMTRCLDKSFAVLANDDDPDGNLPLGLVSVSYGGLRGTASVSGSSILFEPNDIASSASVAYVMKDSLGATDSATLTITITDGTCPAPQSIEGEPAAQPSEEGADPPDGALSESGAEGGR